MPSRRRQYLVVRMWVARAALAAAVAAILAYLPYRFLDDGDLAKLGPMRIELDGNRKRIAELQAENAAYRDHIRALRNDVAAIESLARDDLGFVYKGELIIRVSNGGAPSSAE